MSCCIRGSSIRRGEGEKMTGIRGLFINSFLSVILVVSTKGQPPPKMLSLAIQKKERKRSKGKNRNGKKRRRKCYR